jgi:hypothetical protein
MDLTHLEARHREELARLEGIFSSMGYKTHPLEKSATIPYHALLLFLPPPAGKQPVQLVLTFYPVAAEEVKQTLLLQYYLELPFKTDEAGLRRVAELLPDLNNKTVLGHFGITVVPGGRPPTLHYRYVQSLPAAGPITQEAVADVILLVGYTPLLFLDTIETLAAGKISLAHARAQVDAQGKNM